jgi:hypothetical protein
MNCPIQLSHSTQCLTKAANHALRNEVTTSGTKDYCREVARDMERDFAAEEKKNFSQHYKVLSESLWRWHIIKLTHKLDIVHRPSLFNSTETQLLRYHVEVGNWEELISSGQSWSLSPEIGSIWTVKKEVSRYCLTVVVQDLPNVATYQSRGQHFFKITAKA